VARRGGGTTLKKKKKDKKKGRKRGKTGKNNFQRSAAIDATAPEQGMVAAFV